MNVAGGIVGLGSRFGRRVAVEAHAVGTLAQAGMIGGTLPHKLLPGISAIRRYGPMGGSVAMAAARHPGHPGITDELGSLTFEELDLRSNALANAWIAAGAKAGGGIGILCRNHRGFLDAALAAAKTGARIVLLNTDFAGPQMRDVCAREGVEILVHDEEFAAVVGQVEAPLGTFLGWTDGEPGPNAIETLIQGSDSSPPPEPEERAKAILLTSGTTGTPKGAPRESPKSLAPLGALLSKVPFKAEEATYIAAPMFHALGLAHAMLAVGLGSTIVVRRRFDPEEVLEAIARERCSAVVVVPVMLQRMLALPEDTRRLHASGALRIIFCGGSQLEGDLAMRALKEFGPVVYNLYGSTEVAYATIATPEDLAAAPGCAGKPPFGTIVRILDDRGFPLPQGQTGRIFVANGQGFEGYTGGGHKEIIDGLMSSGDVGHFDEGGRLFVDGRDDEMIVSGGENVFPREVEELLVTHDAIDEAAAIGVDDPEHGKRLRAFVALAPDANLTEADVKLFVKENLARFKVPREVIFVDELPRNPTGKVLKRELYEMEVGADG
jgi:fatty-acyl-CoA synthase